MLKKAVLVGGLMMGLGFAAMPAQATVVTTWNYTVNAGFATYTSTGGGHSNITASQTNVYTGDPSNLAWGTSEGSGRSSLDLSNNGLATGSLTTNGAAHTTTTVTANNNPVTGDVLKSATIHDVLQLQATNPLGVQFALPALSFDILYDETDNTGSRFNCAAPSSTSCADILVISNLTNGTFNTSDPNNIFIAQNLPYLGENYTIELFITGLTQLDTAECNSVNAATGGNVPSPGCFGFISQENNDNSFVASLKILDAGPTTNVPEPATVALFGFGLLGMGGMAVRRRRAKA